MPDISSCRWRRTDTYLIYARWFRSQRRSFCLRRAKIHLVVYSLMSFDRRRSLACPRLSTRVIWLTYSYGQASVLWSLPPPAALAAGQLADDFVLLDDSHHPFDNETTWGIINLCQRLASTCVFPSMLYTSASRFIPSSWSLCWPFSSWVHHIITYFINIVTSVTSSLFTHNIRYVIRYVMFKT